MLTVPVICSSVRMSVVIRKPERKKKTVTPKPPGIFSTNGNPACAQNTIRKLTARRPSSDGMCVTGRGGGPPLTAIGSAAGAHEGTGSAEITIVLSSRERQQFQMEDAASSARTAGR